MIEMAPMFDGPAQERGVVAEGAVGARWAGRSRLFRYGVRRWRGRAHPGRRRGGRQPAAADLRPGVARRMLDLVPAVPTPVWGRDALQTGEMWNSNSVVAWLVSRSGIEAGAIAPPAGGRAPGWRAGLVAAR